MAEMKRELSPRAHHHLHGRGPIRGSKREPMMHEDESATGKIPVVEATAHGGAAEKHRSKSGLEKNQLARQRSIESADTEEIG
jgi:hypothetical protein